MRRILFATVFLFTLMPISVSAHALPVASVPEQSAQLSTVPAVLSITFSERVDASASAVSIVGPDGTPVSDTAYRAAEDPRTLQVALSGSEDGMYRVVWSVVSSDDGHYTRGEYPFFVGAVATTSASAPVSEIVQISTHPEALAMTVELLGNGMLWAALLLFALVFRSRLQGYEGGTRTAFIRAYGIYVLTALGLALSGGVAQIVIKTFGLAEVRLMDFWTTLPLYIQTTSGAATTGRVLMVGLFALVWLYTRRRILTSATATWYEYVLGAILLCFAFLRAIISHATANPFHPEISVFINVLHLIEKDVWAGILVLMVGMLVTARLAPILNEVLPRISALLAINMGLVSATAAYIVWLHLKSFDYLFTTSWGSVFLNLLVCACLLVALRTYHVYALWRGVGLRYAPVTVGIECALAVMMVYCSSVVIITSPPIGTPAVAEYSERSNGLTLSLGASAYEDARIVLKVSGEATVEPVVTVSDDSASETLSLALRREYGNVFSMPRSVFGGDRAQRVSVTVPQPGAYDARADWLVPPHAFEIPEDWEARRSLDSFALVFVGVAILALLFAGVLLYAARSTNARRYDYTSRIKGGAVGALIAGVFVAGGAIGYADTHALFNPFKYACEDAGNMWHVMVPTRAGVALSTTPREGCMWGMGKYSYLIADEDEYRALTGLPHALVTFDTGGPIVEGRKTSITVSLRETNGTPARLSIDMEKLLHVVIVSEDQSVFAHIHADDMRTLTAQEIETSTFTVPFVFPKAGRYMISADYAHGLTLETVQKIVDVQGSVHQSSSPRSYPLSDTFDGYTVALTHSALYAGEAATLKYTFAKDGKPVTDMEPWLSAAMHISVVKNDLSAFVHTHGEVHPPGVPLPPVRIKNGQVVHTMAAMQTPAYFGPVVDAHTVFPDAGTYTIWGEFRVGSRVIPTAFTVRVQ